MHLQNVSENSTDKKATSTQEGDVMEEPRQAAVAGWRECVALPNIGVPGVDTKIDTGTSTCVLYTSFIEHYRRDNELWVRFCVNPLVEEKGFRVVCQAPVKSTQVLETSDNQNESLFVIETDIEIGGLRTRQDIILKAQQGKKYMMHLGRSALQSLNIMIDPNSSYLFGDTSKDHYKQASMHT